MTQPFHRQFFVPGIPRPGGSKSGFPYVKKDGSTGVRMVDSSKYVKKWRKTVAIEAEQAMNGEEFSIAPIGKGIPLRFGCYFIMPRPKGHYGTGRNAGKLKPSAPVNHVIKPDTTKLLRAVEDALTGIMWHDDCQVCNQSAVKRYPTEGHPEPGVYVTVSTLEGTK